MRAEALDSVLITDKSKAEPTIARLLGSTALGTILEWYDFSVFAYLTPIIAVLFFPKQNPYAAMMMTYGIFAAGFFIRPLGAAFFGHYGDRFGRKKMLVWSLVIISIATTLIGLLPTYSDIGLLAPALLLALRLIQGFCIGGEATGATSFVLETYNKQHRGILGSLAWSAIGVGMLLGSLVATLLTHYVDHDALLDWVWRLPFLFGIFAGLVGFYIRQTIPESFLFRKARQSGQLSASPLLESVKYHKRVIVKVTALYALSAMITYLIFIFMPNYAASIIGIPVDQASLVATMAIACVTFIMPLAGWLSDRIGRLPCLKYAAFGFVTLSYPLFYLMTVRPMLSTLVIVQSIFVVMAILYQGVITAAVQELSEIRIRYSVSAIGYNLSYSLFGGTAPLIATYLVHITHLKAAPGLYLALGGFFALITVCTLRETAHNIM